jgi:hypothetical protein
MEREEYGGMVKETYALAGAALSQAQYFERALINHLARVMLNRRIHTRQDWDNLMERLNKCTCGQLLSLVTELGISDQKLPKVLLIARDNRNELVHGFFYYNAEDMLSKEGIQRIQARLTEIIQQFDAAVSRLDNSSTLLRSRLGLSAERIDNELSRLILEAT